MKFEEMLEESIDCGYVRKKALKEVDKLSPEKVRLLAAMAITYHDSVFSDSQRDLARGTTLVLERPYYWDRPADEIEEEDEDQEEGEEDDDE